MLFVNNILRPQRRWWPEDRSKFDQRTNKWTGRSTQLGGAGYGPSLIWDPDFPGPTLIWGAGLIELPPKTLAHGCGRRVVIPATGDVDELFLSSDKLSSIVGPYYIGHSSPSYKAFSSGNPCTGVHRTKYFHVYCSGGEARKLDHQSFLRAAPDSQAFLSVSRPIRRHIFDKKCIGSGWFQG